MGCVRCPRQPTPFHRQPLPTHLQPTPFSNFTARSPPPQNVDTCRKRARRLLQQAISLVALISIGCLVYTEFNQFLKVEVQSR